MTVYLALQFPETQTFIIKHVTASLSKGIDGEIKIERIYLIFFNKFIAKGVSVVSPAGGTRQNDSLPLPQNDTLLNCKKISLSLSTGELLKFRLKLGKVELSDGSFNIYKEDSLNTNLNRIFKIGKKAEKEKKNGNNLKFVAERLSLRNFRFTLKNPYKYEFKGDSVINYSNLRLSDINLRASEIRLKDGTLKLHIGRLSAADSSGYKLQRLRGELSVNGEEARIENIILEDNFSQIKGDFFAMRYRDPKNLAEFVDSVELDISMNNSILDFRTIGKMSPSMQGNELAIILTGEVKGPVRDLRSRSLNVATKTGLTNLNIDFNLMGLPDVNSTICMIGIYDCSTTAKDLEELINSFSARSGDSFLNKMSPEIRYGFRGNLTGLLTDFVAHGQLTSSVGSASVDVLLKSDKEMGGFIIKGDINTHELNIGKILNTGAVGELTMKSDISALIRSGNRGINLSIDSIRIDRLHVNGYDYSNIFAIGNFDKDVFDGRVICHDPNLDFIFQGIITLHSKGGGEYKFYADVPYADLHALNIDTRDSVSTVKFRISSNYHQTADNDIFGNIKILNANYRNSSGEYDMGTIELLSKNIDSSYTSTLKAPFIRMRYNATAPLSVFIKKLTALALYDNIPNLFDEKSAANMLAREGGTPILAKGDRFDFSAEIFDSQSICQLIKPGLYIHDSTRLRARIDEENNLEVKLGSGRLAVNGDYIKGVDIDFDNKDSLFNFRMSCNNILVSGIPVDNSILKISGKENRLGIGFNFRNDTSSRSYGAFTASLDFRKDTISAGIDSTSSLSIKGDSWNLRESEILFSGDDVHINNFGLDNADQHLVVNGLISKTYSDSVLINLNNFDIDILNLFSKKDFNFQGYFSGDAKITSVLKDPNMFLDMKGSSVSISGTPVGDVRILSKWSREYDRFNLLFNTKYGDENQLTSNGYYSPKNSELNIQASLNRLPVAYFEPFLEGVFSRISGTVSGEMRLSGPLNKLKLSSEQMNIDDFTFLVDYTNVPYTVSGTMELSEKGVKAKDLTIKDFEGGSGRIQGGFEYDYFKDIALNANINFRNLLCINTSEFNSDIFYGTTYASGRMSIKGALNSLTMDLMVNPDENSSLHIPLSSAANATRTNILTFKQRNIQTYVDPYEILMASKKVEKKEGNMQIKMKASMNRNMNIFLEINKETGDVIMANGNGTIDINVNPAKEIFTMFGDYNINVGNYRFVLPGFAFASKDFEIQPGGTISFNGNIENTNLNLTAAYVTKASINTLIADTSSVSARRNVECTIHLSGNLMNPRLKLGVDIPDLDPITKVKVENALNSEGKIQKQFAALLISGGFLPDEQSGITNNTTILQSNASEILSKQLNNIFQQLGIPLDLGFNYQPTTGGSDIFDVAVSTQLFNNRVLINGNIGNDPYASSNSHGSVIGNIDVEVKIDRNGRLRMTFFSHAADKYSNFLDDTQRSGVGVSYQQEFNSFREIFQKKSPIQKEMEKREREEQKARRKAAKEKARAKSDEEAISQP